MDYEALERRLASRRPGPLNVTRQFAVFVPVVSQGGVPSLLFEVRGKHLRRQPGEICFPGGALDPGETAEQAALRELEEELGVEKEKTRIFGPLDYLQTRQRRVIYPILGSLEHSGGYRLSEAEVERVFYVPVDQLAEPEEYARLTLEVVPEFSPVDLGLSPDYRWEKGEEVFPVYRIPEEKVVIWGFTARIAHQAACFLAGREHRWE